MNFFLNFMNASQDSDRLNKWIEEWIIQCPTQEDYLRKLGSERIMFLKGKSSADAWKYEMLMSESDLSIPSGFNSTEMMVVAAAREIKEIVVQRDYQTVLSGIGSPGLAAWLAFYLLKKEDYHIDLMTGTGQVGFAPRPGDPFLMTLSNVMTCEMLTDTVELYGTFVGGANNKCLSVIGTAQIDQNGNINTSKMGGLYFIGVGGAADALNASEALVVTKQSRERLVEKVTFVSCSGQRIKTLVTDLGVFKKLEGEKTFTLTKYFTVPSMQGRRPASRDNRKMWLGSKSRKGP